MALRQRQGRLLTGARPVGLGEALELHLPEQVHVRLAHRDALLMVA